MTSLRDIATRTVQTIGPHESVERAIAAMTNAGFRHLPVIENGRLVGILSDRDIFTAVGGLLEPRRSDTDPEETAVAAMPKVMEIMTREVRTQPLDSTAGAAARLMVEHKIGAVPLMDEGGLAGIVSETDLLRVLRDLCIEAGPEHSCHEPVGGHMTRDVITVGLDDELEVAITLFRSHHIRHLPVLEEGRLVGVVGDRDVRRALGRESVVDQQAEAAGDVVVGRNRIRDIMSDEPVTIHPAATLAEAAHVMLNERVGSLVVVDGDDMVGIITETDLIRILIAEESS